MTPRFDITGMMRLWGTAALRRTAEPKPQQPRARRRTPKQVSTLGGRSVSTESRFAARYPI